MRQLALGCVLGILSLAASASAGERNWYFGIEGGVERDGVYNESSSAWDSPALLATVGAMLSEHLSLEGEVGYRSTNNDGYYDIEQITGTINAVYNVPVSDEFAISLGAGVGIDHLNFEPTDPVIFAFFWGVDASDTQAALQFKLGAAFALSEGTDLVANYRMMKTFENEWSDIRNSTLTVGLRFAL